MRNDGAERVVVVVARTQLEISPRRLLLADRQECELDAARRVGPEVGAGRTSCTPPADRTFAARRSRRSAAEDRRPRQGTRTWADRAPDRVTRCPRSPAHQQAADVRVGREQRQCDRATPRQRHGVAVPARQTRGPPPSTRPTELASGLRANAHAPLRRTCPWSCYCPRPSTARPWYSRRRAPLPNPVMRADRCRRSAGLVVAADEHARDLQVVVEHDDVGR